MALLFTATSAVVLAVSTESRGKDQLGSIRPAEKKPLKLSQSTRLPCGPPESASDGSKGPLMRRQIHQTRTAVAPENSGNTLRKTPLLWRSRGISINRIAFPPARFSPFMHAKPQRLAASEATISLLAFEEKGTH